MKSFTSESVCAGHPDKICDQTSDAILDEALKKDRFSRVSVETIVTKNFVVIAGEITSKAKLDYKSIARSVIKKLGYTNPKFKFTDRSPITVKIHTQSKDIARGVDKMGAGDQGMMYGYACSDTKEFMPLPIQLAHQLAMKIDEARILKLIPYLRPDGKTQATVKYDDGKPVDIETIVMAVAHNEKVKLNQVKEDLYNDYQKHIKSKGKHNTTLDRINNNGHYEKGNCRWATFSVQNRNQNRRKIA